MMKLSQINKSDIEVIKDSDFSSLGFVTHKNSIMLVFLEDTKYLGQLINNNDISCVITKPELIETLPDHLGTAVSENPRRSFYELHNDLAKTDFYWKNFATLISQSAQISKSAFIAPQNVRIGDRVIIEPNVTIQEKVIIDEDVIIRSGTVIGSVGFEFNLIDNEILSVAHAGGVYIKARVEIQSNTCVDRAIFGGFTEIGEDTKIDNLIHIAHNVRIGKRCRIAAGAMIAGSVTLGDEVWVGPSASISSEINVGDRSYISIGSVVTKHVPPLKRVTGNFAIDHEKFINFIKSIR